MIDTHVCHDNSIIIMVYIAENFGGAINKFSWSGYFDKLNTLSWNGGIVGKVLTQWHL